MIQRSICQALRFGPPYGGGGGGGPVYGSVWSGGTTPGGVAADGTPALIVKSLIPVDSVAVIPISQFANAGAAESPAVDEGGGGGGGGSSSPTSSRKYVREPMTTKRRSAYAVIRTRDTAPDVCARQLLQGSIPAANLFASLRTPDTTAGDRMGSDEAAPQQRKDGEAASSTTHPAHSAAAGSRCASCSCCCCCSAMVYSVSPNDAERIIGDDPSFDEMPHNSNSLGSIESMSESEANACDDFLFATHLSGMDEDLRILLGNALYSQVVSPSRAHARFVNLCSSKAIPINDAALPSSESRDSVVARMLLASEEENRVKWWFEDGMPAASLARMPSFRALYVTFSRYLARHPSVPVVGPTNADLREIWIRVCNEDNSVLLTDLAALYNITRDRREFHAELYSILAEYFELEILRGTLNAMGSGSVDAAHSKEQAPERGSYAANVVRDAERDHTAANHSPHLPNSGKRSQPRRRATDAHSHAPGAVHIATYRHLYFSMLIFHLLRSEVEQRMQVPSESVARLIGSVKVFELIHKCMQHFKPMLTIQASDPSSPLNGSASEMPLLRALRSVIGNTQTLLWTCAETWDIPAESDALPTFTLLLLIHKRDSTMCRAHFRRMIERNSSAALDVLIESGLLSLTDPNLPVIVDEVIPLLDACHNEDFMFSVVREVITALERRSRTNIKSFTEDQLRYVAAFGTRLYATHSAELNNGQDIKGGGRADGAASRGGAEKSAQGSGSPGSFDYQEQWQELQVMDGSPWALVTFTARSLREIIRALLEDQRRLKKHVKEQMLGMTGGVMGAAGDGGNHPSPSSQGTGGASKNETSEKTNITNDSGNSRGETGGRDEHGRHGEKTAKADGSETQGANTESFSGVHAEDSIIVVPYTLRHRFLLFVEHLVKAIVDENARDPERAIVISTELFSFIHNYVPIPNIHDEYRRKVFLLVNVAKNANAVEGVVQPDEEATGLAAFFSEAKSADDANHIPEELRQLVALLPLTLSPWASVMILRDVLSESAGNNPRYTYVLNAAIDLQLPMSTTRSRIATTLNMWRYLNSQSHKLTLIERTALKQRCALNLPLSYILSSYWSLLSWSLLAIIIGFNIVGLDLESQYVATQLSDMFAPQEEQLAPLNPDDEVLKEDTERVVAQYFGEDQLAHHNTRDGATGFIISSASYVFLGTDDQRRPMTVIAVRNSNEERSVPTLELPDTNQRRTSNAEKVAQVITSYDPSVDPLQATADEFARATAVIRTLSANVAFPFFVEVERNLPIELLIARVADRIRRTSSNNAWFVSRMVFRTFPLGRSHTEHGLVSHTCTQANLIRRRVTFVLYFNEAVAVTPQILALLRNSVLAVNANLVIVAHERSLARGGAATALTKCRESRGALPSVLEVSSRDFMRYLSMPPVYESKAEDENAEKLARALQDAVAASAVSRPWRSSILSWVLAPSRFAQEQEIDNDFIEGHADDHPLRNLRDALAEQTRQESNRAARWVRGAWMNAQYACSWGTSRARPQRRSDGGNGGTLPSDTASALASHEAGRRGSTSFRSNSLSPWLQQVQRTTLEARTTAQLSSEPVWTSLVEPPSSQVQQAVDITTKFDPFNRTDDTQLAAKALSFVSDMWSQNTTPSFVVKGNESPVSPSS